MASMRHRLRALFALLASGLIVGHSMCQSVHPENQTMQGTWQLESYSYTDGEVPFEGDLPQANALENWLYPEIRLLWYESEGAQIESPNPTKGMTRHVPGRDAVFLHPSEVPSWMTRSRDNERDSLRYDDGDTLICDLVRMENGSLVRIISVVTDEIYLNRIIAVHKRIE